MKRQISRLPSSNRRSRFSFEKGIYSFDVTMKAENEKRKYFTHSERLKILF